MGGKWVVVTGGLSVLGFFVVERLRRTEWCGEVFVPRIHEYDLREKEAILRLYQDARPHIIIHLAGIGGGIGANLANPGSFSYDNLLTIT